MRKQLGSHVKNFRFEKRRNRKNYTVYYGTERLLLYIWRRVMTKGKIKAFIKDHKHEIAIGAMFVVGTICMVVSDNRINEVCCKKMNTFKEANEGLNQFNNDLCEAMSGCNYYIPVTYDEVCCAATNDHLRENRWSDPDGSVIEIKKFIAFGNKVEL